MKRSLLVCPALWLLHIACCGQTTQWGLSFTSYISNAYRAVCDSSGNVIVIGSFEGEMDVAPGPDSLWLSSGVGTNAFIAKYNTSGGLLWAASWGSDNNPCCIESAYVLALDEAGNILIAGVFEGIVDFDPGPGSYQLSGSSEIWNGYLLKLSAAGEFIWVRHFESSVYSSADLISIGPDNSIFVNGELSVEIDLDPGLGLVSETGPNDDLFLVKLDSNGLYQWGKTYGSLDDIKAWGLLAHSSGEVYLTGRFQGSVDFNPGGTPHLLTTEHEDGFILHLNANGDFEWAAQIWSSERCALKRLTETPLGNLLVIGQNSGTVDLDPGTDTDYYTSLFTMGFLLKLTTDLNLISAHRIGQSGSGMFVPESVLLSPLGDIFIGGLLSGSMDLDPGPGVEMIFSFGYVDAILISLSPMCNLQWADHFGGNVSQNSFCGLSLDPSGSLYGVGYFRDDMDIAIGSDTLILADSSEFGIKNGFLMKVANPVAIDHQQDKVQLSVFPNPSQGHVNVVLPSDDSQVELELTDVMGRVIQKWTETGGSRLLIELPCISGIYLLRANVNGKIAWQKIIRQ